MILLFGNLPASSVARQLYGSRNGFIMVTLYPLDTAAWTASVGDVGASENGDVISGYPLVN